MDNNDTQIEEYSTFIDEEDIKIQNAKKNINIVKEKLIDNISNIVERGQKIDLLVTDTETLENSSLKFYDTSQKLKWAFYLKNLKCKIFALISLLIIIFFIIVTSCGGFKFENC